MNLSVLLHLTTRDLRGRNCEVISMAQQYANSNYNFQVQCASKWNQVRGKIPWHSMDRYYISCATRKRHCYYPIIVRHSLQSRFSSRFIITNKLTSTTPNDIDRKWFYRCSAKHQNNQMSTIITVSNALMRLWNAIIKM